MILDPNLYPQTPVRELLQAAAYGRVGVDRRFIQAIIDRGADAAKDVLAFTRENHDKDPVEIDGVLVDLLRYFGSDEALEFYIDVIRRDPSDVDDQMVLALLPFGERAIAPLIALYEEVGEERGSDVAFVLAGLQLRDDRILNLLLDRLDFDAADGAFLLGLYGDPAAKERLEAILVEVPADDIELIREFSYAIDQLGREIEPYKPEPFDILKEYPKRDTPMMEALKHSERLELLGHADAETRAAAAYSFFNQENNAETQKRLIEAARNDADPGVRGRAWAAVADAASEAKDAAAIRDEMIAVVNDASRHVEERGGAAVGLYGVADHPAATEAIEKLYAEGGRARVRALEAMWRSMYPPFAKYFAKHLDDADVSTVRHALRGAGYFKLTQSIEKIASYFDRDDEYEDLREDALFAYAMAMPGETSRGRAKGMLRKIDELTELSLDEVDLVKFAIDERLQLAGLKPVFSEEGHAPEPPAAAAPPASGKVGRNDPCPCGSGKKYKKCHGA